MTNYYLILGLPDFSSETAIKKQYRKLAKIYHPDVNQNNPSAEHKFKQVVNAYEKLSKPLSKKQVDDALLDKKNAVYAAQPSREEIITNARKRAAAMKKHAIETKYFQYEQSFLKINYRIGIAVFFMSLLFFIFMFNYYPNYESEAAFAAQALVGLSFAGFIYLLVDAYYLKSAYNKQTGPEENDHSARNAGYLFLLLFFLSPILGGVFANIRREYLLTQGLQCAEIQSIVQNEYENEYAVNFYANYKSYTCKYGVEKFSEYPADSLCILYYPSDPRISKLELKSKKQ